MFRKILLVIVVLSFSGWLWADVLITKEGREIEGKVVEKDGLIWLKTVTGSIAFNKDDVKKVVKKSTIFDEYEKKLSKVDSKDLKANEELLNWCVDNKLRVETRDIARRTFLIKAKDFKPKKELRIKVEELADWCRRYGLDGQGRELYREVYSRELSGLHQNDWRGRVALAKWCEQRDLNKESVELFAIVLKHQPDNSYANLALGNVKVGGEWIHREVLEKEKAEAVKQDVVRDVTVIVQEPAPVVRSETVIIERSYPTIYRRVYPYRRSGSTFSFGFSNGKWDLRWGYNDRNRPRRRVYRRPGHSPRPRYYNPRDRNRDRDARDRDRPTRGTRGRDRGTRSRDTRGPLRKHNRR